MKFNVLYLVWALAFLACFWLKDNFMGRGNTAFFGATETESRILNFDNPVIIQDVLVKTGDEVQAGDTLMVFYRAELDQETANRLGDINQFNVEKNAKNSILDKSLDVLKAQHQAKLSELQAQIRIEEAEYQAESGVRKLLGESDTANGIDPLRAEKIAALRTQIQQNEQEYAVQIKELKAERSANQSIFDARNAKVQVELDFVKAERQRLVLTAPVDGFVESITVGTNEIVPQYKELIKINPRQPTRIRGFIYESAEISYKLGDTVKLSSYSRRNVRGNGVIIGGNPQVVELPVRLRKVAELRTWGRELYIKIPSDNPFFLNEKIVISFE
ncbi:HlyD family efflux transporter periplasmic adaptor subunit [Haliscomenobacter hydrossis]|uniref:Secretion protein HlyD family protein n=1 Tax=Haliscomenobacter hydrossis (strain ATCC 27775 / DSM 1100 / LMG 10767 / O) TaxID=760192 RepID=F4L267_HALH1|nr:HlyD family efflux transporter periplasmic adaptor subunit [Haliscomenobacter hydrossis]AEE51674.1 hypothetical protein Halhy_3822 [Haliscomenobacter hydrossis DSM 1100]